MSKVLTINNPSAYFVAAGLKDVENRTWWTDYRGRMLIHANKKPFVWPDAEDLPDEVVFDIEQAIKRQTPFDELTPIVRGYEILLRRAETHLDFKDNFDATDEGEALMQAVLKEKVALFGFPFVSDSIIGEVDLVDIVDDSDSPWSANDNFHWILKNAKIYDKPILGVKGKLRLWNFTGN